MPIVAPSKISDYKAREMTKGEILEVIEMFVEGIENVKEEGFACDHCVAICSKGAIKDLQKDKHYLLHFMKIKC